MAKSRRTIAGAILALLLVVSSAHAAAGWTSKDTLWQASYLTLHVIDWGQSIHIARTPELYEETNPLLGATPSVGAVNTYFAATAVGHTAVSYLLPQPYRRYWQYLTIGLESAVIANNFRLGIKIDF